MSFLICRIAGELLSQAEREKDSARRSSKKHSKNSEKSQASNSKIVPKDASSSTFTEYLLNADALNANEKVLFITDLLGAGDNN